MNRFQKIFPFLLILILIVIGVVYAFNKKAVAPVAPQAPASDTLSSDTDKAGSVAEKPDPSKPVSYRGEEGKTAMQLLKSKHVVETKNYSFGEMVTSIDGVNPDARHFWGFYVNGKLAQVGADAYVTKATDSIEWKLEEIK